MVIWADVSRKMTEIHAYVIVALRGDFTSFIDARTLCSITGFTSAAKYQLRFQLWDIEVGVKTYLQLAG